MIGHLDRQVEAVAVALEGVRLDQGQTLGADTGEFQGAFVPGVEGEGRVEASLRASPETLRVLPSQLTVRGDSVGAAFPHQVLGL